MVGGDAVLEAVRSAGVLRHVAAQGAGALAGGVGGVVEPVGQRRIGEAGVDDARLDHRAAALRVEVQDSVEAGQDDQHGVGCRERSAGEPGAGPAGHKRHGGHVQQADDGDEFGAVSREHGEGGARGVRRQAVGFVRGELGGPRADPARSHDPPELRRERLAHGATAMSGWGPPSPLLRARA